MRLRILLAGLALGIAAAARAETTPLSEPLVEEKEILITCELTEAPKRADIPVFETSAECQQAKGTYHYKLWLPKGYLADPQRRWPCMFNASSGGNTSALANPKRLKAGGYVGVGLVESKNGPWPPIIGNFLAAHDDLIKRVRIQEGLKFATGVSGGGRASSMFVQIRPGFGGTIMQGAGAAYAPGNQGKYATAGIRANPSLYSVFLVGNKDANAKEIPKMKDAFPAERFTAMEWDGGHGSAPGELFSRALDWIEQKIYVEGPPNPALRAVYLQQFKSEHERFAAATGPWERYKLADSLMNLARSRSLADDPSVAPVLRVLQAQAPQLRSDPAVAKEAAAADALKRLEVNRARTPPARFAADCAELAKRYPGTEAAAKASEMAGAAK